jgi:hypothetical protein
MAQSYETSKELGKGHVRIKGAFTPNGAAVSTASGATTGVGFTPSYVSTGIYRLTLDDAFLGLVSAPSLVYQQISSGTDLVHVQIGDVSVANKTIDIITYVAAAKANITASGILRRIHFELHLALVDVPGSGIVAA